MINSLIRIVKESKTKLDIMNKFFTSLIKPGTSRAFSILVAAFVFIIDITIQLADIEMLNVPMVHVIFQLLVVSNLIIAASLQLSDSDEREKTIRANLNRIMLPLFLLFMCGVAFALGLANNFTISTIFVFYAIEIGLISYLILYNYGMNNSPKWLLQERKLKDSERLALVLAPIFTLPIVFSFLLGYLSGQFIVEFFLNKLT